MKILLRHYGGIEAGTRKEYVELSGVPAAGDEIHWPERIILVDKTIWLRGRGSCRRRRDLGQAMTLNKRVTYTVWCDDGRYCDPRAGKTFVTTNKAEAVVAAKKLGWEIKPRYAARLPQLCEEKAMSVHEVSPEWISNPDNIFRFGGVLEWADVLNTATDVLDYLEKP